MADIIARTRLLIADPAGPSQQFTDDNIQDFLDETRMDVRYEALEPRPTYTTSGIQWLDYYSAYEHWEASETLIWTNFSTLTPVTPTVADRIRGHWAFSPSQLPAVLIAGANYDVWLVAANLLDMRVTALSLTTFDFTAGGQSFHAGQIITNLQKQANAYRAKARVEVATMVRGDVIGSNETTRRAEVGPVSADVPFVTGP